MSLLEKIMKLVNYFYKKVAIILFCLIVAGNSYAVIVVENGTTINFHNCAFLVQGTGGVHPIFSSVQNFAPNAVHIIGGGSIGSNTFAELEISCEDMVSPHDNNRIELHHIILTRASRFFDFGAGVFEYPDTRTGVSKPRIGIFNLHTRLNDGPGDFTHEFGLAYLDIVRGIGLIRQSVINVSF